MTSSTFRPGATVVYTESHATYLSNAGRWPSRRLARRAHRGTVVSSTAAIVTVDWRYGSVTTHLAENLEAAETSLASR